MLNIQTCILSFKFFFEYDLQKKKLNKIKKKKKANECFFTLKSKKSITE